MLLINNAREEISYVIIYQELGLEPPADRGWSWKSGTGTYTQHIHGKNFQGYPEW